jgi:PPK2 family polyphosphate:nucleotide phosphotransferase
MAFVCPFVAGHILRQLAATHRPNEDGGAGESPAFFASACTRWPGKRCVMLKPKLLNRLVVTPGTRFRLKDHDPDWKKTARLKQLSKTVAKEEAKEILEDDAKRLAAAQDLLWADGARAVLVILQAMDAGGKDGTIKHVMSGLNPQGVQVCSFKKPTDEESSHNFLWRYARNVPERGRIGIFNRSYYEDVLVPRVHPELVAKLLPPKEKPGNAFWQGRYDDINGFEHHLARSGTLILKFFLNISKAEQRRRLLARIDDPQKQWKFSAADLAERAEWNGYAQAYEKAITATSTPWAPWHIIPADAKWVCRTLVADVLAHAIESLGLEYPRLTAADRRALAKARKTLGGK